MKKAIFILVCWVLYSCAGYTQIETPVKYVVLITIDGFRAEMLNDPTMPSPVLKELAQHGTWIQEVVPVAPALTYPNHTTIITGVVPEKHGIYYNSPFEGNVKTGIAYWYADSIRSPTIWHAAKQNGLTTCSIFWPASVNCKDIDYNIPEYWPLDPNVDQWSFRKKYTSPPQLMDEIETYNSGQLNDSYFIPGKRTSDVRAAFMASYLLDKYRPHLTTIHLWSTDASQHASGTTSNETRKSVAAVDFAIGHIIEDLQRTKMLDSTVIVVCGDHGFTDITQLLAPNVWLTQTGLLSADPNNWKAKFHTAGSVGFLYLKDKNDTETLIAVRRKLASLPKNTQSLFRIVEKDELSALGCSPDVALAIEPVSGIGVTSANTGSDIIEKTTAQHGYLQARELTSALFYGKGVQQGKTIRRIHMTEIAPMVMNVLGISFPSKTK